MDETLHNVWQGESISYKEVLAQLKEHISKLPTHQRHKLYLWLSKEFGVAKF